MGKFLITADYLLSAHSVTNVTKYAALVSPVSSINKHQNQIIIDMEKNMFYKHVSSWIESYYNAEALEWLRRFISNSNQAQELKERLFREVDRKIAALTNMPFWGEYDGMQLLMDEHCHPQIFTTRYKTMSKVAQLRLMGYDARLLEGGVFFRIQLVQPAPVNFLSPVNEQRRNEPLGSGLKMIA